MRNIWSKRNDSYPEWYTDYDARRRKMTALLVILFAVMIVCMTGLAFVCSESW